MELRQLGLRLLVGRSLRRRNDGLEHSIAQPVDGAGELLEGDERCRRREDRVGVLKGSLLPERYEDETEQREKRHGGFGDAASPDARTIRKY